MGRIADFFLGVEPTEARDAVAPLPSDPTNVTPPPRTPATRAVNQEEALSLSMVYRAIGIHVTSIIQMSLEVHRGSTVAKSVPGIIRKPDVNNSQHVFIEQTVVSLAVSGNAYWLKDIDPDTGKVVNLSVLNPHDVTITADINGIAQSFNYKDKTYGRDKIKHLALMRVPGTPYGLGPIQAAKTELRGTLDVRDYAGNWFVESGIPNGVLKSDQPLTADAAQQVKDSWNTTQGGSKGVAVLGNGFTYTPIYLSPEDAQFLENQKFNVTQVARLFGVPSSLMLATVEGNTQTYANVEQDWIGYVRFSLMKYIVEIEDALTEFTAGTARVKFNVDALLRNDTKTRYEAHEIGIRAGFLTKDEARALENLPPLEEVGAADTSTDTNDTGEDTE